MMLDVLGRNSIPIPNKGIVERKIPKNILEIKNKVSVEYMKFSFCILILIKVT